MIEVFVRIKVAEVLVYPNLHHELPVSANNISMHIYILCFRSGHQPQTKRAAKSAQNGDKKQEYYQYCKICAAGTAAKAR